jgi:hypothetical protein
VIAEHLEIMERMAKMARKVLKERKETSVRKELLDPRELKVIREMMVIRVNRVQKDHLAKPGPMEMLEELVNQGVKEILESPDRKDLQGQLEKKAMKAPKVNAHTSLKGTRSGIIDIRCCPQ